MSHHGVQDGQELVHGGNQGHFLGFALGTEALIEGADDGIAACRGDDRT